MGNRSDPEDGKGSRQVEEEELFDQSDWRTPISEDVEITDTKSQIKDNLGWGINWPRPEDTTWKQKRDRLLKRNLEEPLSEQTGIDPDDGLWQIVMTIFRQKPKKYLRITPTDTEPTPDWLINELSELYHSGETPNTLESWLGKYGLDDSTAYEFLIVKARESNRFNFYLGVEPDEDLSTVQATSASAYPANYSFQYEAVRLPKLFDGEMPHLARWNGKGTTRKDWMTRINPFGKHEAARSPLANMFEKVVETDEPWIFQVVFKSRPSFAKKSQRYNLLLQNNVKTWPGLFFQQFIDRLFGVSEHEKRERFEPNQSNEIGGAVTSDDEPREKSGRTKHLDKKQARSCFDVTIRAATTDKELAEGLTDSLERNSGRFYNLKGRYLGQDDQELRRLFKRRLTRPRKFRQILRFYREKPMLVLSPEELANFTTVPSIDSLPKAARGATGGNPKAQSPLTSPDEEVFRVFENGMCIGEAATAVDEGVDETISDSYDRGEDWVEMLQKDEALHLKADHLTQHYIRAGRTGTGKTVATINDMLSAYRNLSGPTVLLDRKGGGMVPNYCRCHRRLFGDDSVDDVDVMQIPEEDGQVPGMPFFDLRPLLTAGDMERSVAIQAVTDHYRELMKTVLGEDTFERAFVANEILGNIAEALFDKDREYVTKHFFKWVAEHGREVVAYEADPDLFGEHTTDERRWILDRAELNRRYDAEMCTERRTVEEEIADTDEGAEGTNEDAEGGENREESDDDMDEDEEASLGEDPIIEDATTSANISDSHTGGDDGRDDRGPEEKGVLAGLGDYICGPPGIDWRAIVDGERTFEEECAILAHLQKNIDDDGTPADGVTQDDLDTTEWGQHGKEMTDIEREALANNYTVEELEQLTRDDLLSPGTVLLEDLGIEEFDHVLDKDAIAEWANFYLPAEVTDHEATAQEAERVPLDMIRQGISAQTVEKLGLDLEEAVQRQRVLNNVVVWHWKQSSDPVEEDDLTSDDDESVSDDDASFEDVDGSKDAEEYIDGASVNPRETSRKEILGELVHLIRGGDAYGITEIFSEAMIYKDRNTDVSAGQAYAPYTTDEGVEAALRTHSIKDDMRLANTNDAVTNRISKLRSREFIWNTMDYVPEWDEEKGWYAEDEPVMDFHSLLQSDTVLMVDMGDLRKESTQIFSVLFLSHLHRAAQSEGNIDRRDNEDYVANVIVEEAAPIAASTIMYEELLPQGREFGLSIGLIMQYPEQIKQVDRIDTDVPYREIINNVGTKIVGSISSDDDLVDMLFHEGLDESEMRDHIAGLARGEFIVQLPATEFREQRPEALSLKPLPIPPGHAESENTVASRMDERREVTRSRFMIDESQTQQRYWMDPVERGKRDTSAEKIPKEDLTVSTMTDAHRAVIKEILNYWNGEHSTLNRGESMDDIPAAWGSEREEALEELLEAGMVEQDRLEQVTYYWIEFEVLGKLGDGYDIKHGEGIGDPNESPRHKLVVGAAKQLFEQHAEVLEVESYTTISGTTEEDGATFDLVVRWDGREPTYVEVETGIEEQEQEGNYVRRDGVVADYNKLSDRDGEVLWLVPNKEIAREIANVFSDQNWLDQEITDYHTTYKRINEAIWEDSQSETDGGSIADQGLDGCTRFDAWKKYLQQVQQENPELPGADFYETD